MVYWSAPYFVILAVEVLENLAYLANASNLVLYLTKFMNFSPSASANTVTCFMGTAFLLALAGGFLSDSYFTTYSIYLISAITELLVRFLHTFETHNFVCILHAQYHHQQRQPTESQKADTLLPYIRIRQKIISGFTDGVNTGTPTNR